MFKKFTKVLFIIAMFIQLVPSNIFANENENVFKSNYINLETKGEPTGVYDKAAVDIPEASYKLNVTVNVDGEEKEASTLAYGLSTNPEEVNVTALDGYVIESQKLDNVDYHQEMIVFDRENNIMSKELVVNVTTSPKAELPVELMRTSNYFDYDQFNNNERAGRVAVTFNAGEHGDIKRQDSWDWNWSYTDQLTYNVKIGDKLKDIKIPDIRPNDGYLVSSKPWGDEFNENTIVNGPMSFTAQYEKKAYPKDAYFYLLKPGHKNTENGNEAFLYVGKGRVKDDFLANAGDTDSDHMSYVSEYPSETEINAAIQKEYPNAETSLTWYRIVKSNGAPDQDGNPIVPSKNLTYHIDGYITIKAEDKFTAAFEVAKPSNVDIETQDNISKNTEITMPLKDKNITERGINYTFDGWYLNKDYTQPVENNKYVMTQNQTFYARYLKDNNENSYKVSYLDKETNKKLIKDKTVEKITLPNGDFDKVVNGGTYTEKAQSISGYKVIGLAEKSITVGADSNNNLVFYYEKDDNQKKELSLTINYYKDNSIVETDSNKYSTWIGNDTAKVDPAIVLDNEKYDGYKLDKKATKEAPTSIKNGDEYNIYYVKDTTKWTTVTFNKGTRGSLAGQDADGNVIFKDILKGTTLAANNINAPMITPKENCEVADTPWNNGYAENKVINGETTFTAQYKKNINFTVHLKDDFLVSGARWVHLDKDMIGHNDSLVYTQDQIKDFANEYIGKNGYAKDTYKLVFETKIEYLDNNKMKWKDYDSELNKVLNEGFEVRYHVYIVKKLDVKFDLNNKEKDVNYEVYNGSKLSDKQTVPTPSKTGYTFTGWKMNDNETLYDNDTINGMKFNDNTTFKAQYVEDKSKTKDAKLTVNYFIEGKKVADSYTSTFTMWVNDADKAIDPAIDAKNDKYVGYKLDTEKPATIPTKISKDTEVNIYYVKDASKTKDAKLTVNYFIEGKKVADSYTSTFTMWVNDADKAIKPAIDAKDNKYVGYKLDTEKTATIPTKISKDTEVNIYYVEDKSKTKNMSYQVKYYKDGILVDGATQTVKKEVWVNDTEVALDAIDVSNDKFEGYVFDKTNPEILPETVENEAIIEVHYVKDATKWTKVTFNKGAHGTLVNEDVDGNVISIEVLIGSKLSDNQITDPRIIPNEGWILARPNWNNGYAVDKEVVKDMIFTAQYAEDRNYNEIPDIEEYVTVIFDQGTNGTFTEGTQTKFENLLSGFDALPKAPTPSANEGYEFTGYTPVLPTYVEGTPKSTITYVAQYAEVVTPIVPEPVTPVTPNTPLTPTTPLAPVTPVTPAAPLNPTPVLNPEVVPNEVTPEAKPKEEVVKDDKTPLANHDGCWIHWLMLLLTFLYGIYAAVRIYGRSHTNHKNKKELNEMNKEMEGQAI